MNQEQSIRLIELYRNHSFLWDLKDKAHHNRAKREDAWKEMSAILQLPVSTLKSKMKTLMGTYRSEKSRENKSRITGSGSEDVYESKWFAYKNFEFLRGKNNRNATLDKTRNEESEVETTEVISDTPSGATTSTAASQDSQLRTPTAKDGRKRKKMHGNSKSDKKMGQAAICNTPSVATTSTATSQGSKSSIPEETGKRKKVQDDSDSHKMMGQALQIYQSSSSVLSDPYFTFALNLANELRKYDGQTLAHVKRAIANVLFEADMGMISTDHTMPYVSYLHPQQVYSETSSPRDYGSATSSGSASPTPSQSRASSEGRSGPHS